MSDSTYLTRRVEANPLIDYMVIMGFYVYDPKGYRLPYHPESKWREIRSSAESIGYMETKLHDATYKEQDTIKEAPEDGAAWQAPPIRPGVTVASQIMKKPVITLGTDTSITEAWELFTQKRFRHVPILNEEGKLVGILSDRKLLKEAVEIRDQNPNIQVKDVMVSHVLTATPYTDIADIARTFIEEHIGCVPIVEKNGDVVGMVTRSDILRTIVKLDQFNIRA